MLLSEPRNVQNMLGHVVGPSSLQAAIEACVRDFNGRVNMIMSF